MRPTEKIEKLVRQMSFKAGPEMDKDLWADAASAHDQSQKTQQTGNQALLRRVIMKTPITKAAVVALICTSVVAAAVVGVKIYKYRYVDYTYDVSPIGHHRVISEDGKNTMMFSGRDTDPDQAVAYAEEIALLKQRDDRELVGVTEIEVNGQHDSRLFTYEYNLSDGRTRKVGERDPDDTGPWTLTGERQTEAGRLLQQAVASKRKTGLFVRTDEGTFYVPDEQDEEKEIPTYERVIQGRNFIFEKYTFTLSDGTEVIWAIGRLPEDSPSRIPNAASNKNPVPNDLREWASLRKQGKGQLIAVDELTANGKLDRRVFVYQYQLSDGRTMDMREGSGGDIILDNKKRDEWVQLRDAGSGEDLDTYEEEIEGSLFVFKRQRFILGDGTEIIWSVGTLKDGKQP